MSEEQQRELSTHESYQSIVTEITKLVKKSKRTIGAEDVPIVKIVDNLLQLGYKSKASDLHIEPHEEVTLIRARIDGILHDILEIPSDIHQLITTRIKILSRLRTDEHNATQDGKLRFEADEEMVDVRVSIVPANYGEKTVLRLLSDQSTEHDLASLGFSESDLQTINDQADRPWGMILSTGPTGSGKTTTLYGILKRLNRREVNISTIEDPIEYGIDDINQIQVNPKTNLTFATGLRSLVRQDPDIIMVGEIRDQETAAVAVNAALTGHLVLSTIHTNDSATTLPRLIDMGVPSFLVASTINIAIAQRLVRKVCDNCSEKHAPEKSVLIAAEKQLGKEVLEQFKINEKSSLIYGKGCDECDESGYKGRTVIAEVLEMTEEIKELVMLEKNASDITEKAKEQGMVTMIEDGMQKVVDGKTTLEEILRVAQQ